MPSYFAFFVAFSFILTHELDAVRQHEWRIFPGLSSLSDQRGYVVFTALHVPLFALMLAGIFTGGINNQVVVGLDIFFIIHILLHVLATRHPKNEFHSPLSWTLILGAGGAGAIDLLLRL